MGWRRTSDVGEPTADQSDRALLPSHVRKWVLVLGTLLVMIAVYLGAVRGTAILYDLRDAVAAICF